MLNQQEAVTEVRHIFKQVRQTLKLNRQQTKQAYYFDMLVAIENASRLLNKAWQVTKRYKIEDDWMRQEFIDVFDYFGKIKKDLREVFKGKH